MSKRGAGSDLYKSVRQAKRKAQRLGRNREERRQLLYGGPRRGRGLMDIALDEVARKLGKGVR